jgi:hypothetical protein
VCFHGRHVDSRRVLAHHEVNIWSLWFTCRWHFTLRWWFFKCESRSVADTRWLSGNRSISGDVKIGAAIAASTRASFRPPSQVIPNYCARPHHFNPLFPVIFNFTELNYNSNPNLVFEQQDITEIVIPFVQAIDTRQLWHFSQFALSGNEELFLVAHVHLIFANRLSALAL